jgi:ligand-binding SRPBCC domain-containing protein
VKVHRLERRQRFERPVDRLWHHRHTFAADGEATIVEDAVQRELA